MIVTVSGSRWLWPTGLVLASLLNPWQTFALADDYRGWYHYGGGQHGMQYSSLSQLNTENVHKLEEAWRFRTGELGQGHREPFAFQANPILVEGRLYLPTGSAIVFALDPATGKELWRHDPNIDRSKPHAEIANRGVTSWVDPDADPEDACRHRIFVGTLDARLIALDGATGLPCRDFGEQGQVWLNRGVRADEYSDWVNYTVTSPPVIVGDLVIVGSAIGDNRAVESELGIVRGIDARTGAERWRWDPIPRGPDDPAFPTWQSEEAARTGSANAWHHSPRTRNSGWSMFLPAPRVPTFTVANARATTFTRIRWWPCTPRAARSRGTGSWFITMSGTTISRRSRRSSIWNATGW